MIREGRPLAVEFGVLKQADGSVRYSHGETQVVVAVHGPLAVKQKYELIDRATIEVIWKPAKGIAGEKEKLHEYSLLKSLEKCIYAINYPRSCISIVIQVIHDAGSILSVALNACVFALLHSGIALQTLLVSLEICINEERQVILDPSGEESFYFVFNKSMGLVSSKCIGPVTDQEFFHCLKAAKSMAPTILQFISKAFPKF